MAVQAMIRYVILYPHHPLLTCLHPLLGASARETRDYLQVAQGAGSGLPKPRVRFTNEVEATDEVVPLGVV